VWDVGHQTYPHKILTGRMQQMHTIRQAGGLAGFPKRGESDYDAFGVGHSSTSISAAMGMALAAVEKVGVDRSAVRDALAEAKDEASGYVGVTGVTYFDDEGDCYSKNVYMAVAKDGKFVPAEKQIK